MGSEGDLTRAEGVDGVKGVGLDPHPQQAGPKIPSGQNVRNKGVISSLGILFSGLVSSVCILYTVKKGLPFSRPQIHTAG
jgi:hypothetical protein